MITVYVGNNFTLLYKYILVTVSFRKQDAYLVYKYFTHLLIDYISLVGYSIIKTLRAVHIILFYISALEHV